MPLLWVAALLLLPAAFYANHVYEYLEQAGERHLRVVERAASWFEEDLRIGRQATANLGAAAENFLSQLQHVEPIDTTVCENAISDKSEEGGGILQRPDAILIYLPAGKGGQASCFRLRLDWILQQIPLDTTLDGLLVVNPQGGVVAGTDLHHRLIDLRQLRAQDGEATDKKARQNEAPSRWRPVQEVHFAGHRDRLYCQPLRLDIDPAQAEPWALCGLVPTEEAWQSALEIPANVVVWLLLLLIAGLVSWPLLKLFTSHPRQRFQFVDLLFLGLASFAFLIVAAILVLEGDSYLSMKKRVNEQLERLAGDVASRFTEEVVDLHDELDRYDEELKLNTLAVEKRSESDLLERVKPKEYMIFEQLFWTDLEQGHETFKATIRRQPTPFVSVTHREYWRAVKENRLWTLPEADGFVVQPVRRMTTGDLQVVVARRSSVGDQMAAIIAPLASMTRPVLPPGFAFAVIEPSGRVLFHSENRRSMRENLLDELEDGSRLRSAIVGRTSISFVDDYLRKSRQFYARPLFSASGASRPSAPPWIVVAMRDMETVHTVHLEVLAEAFALAAVYMSLIVVCALVYIASSRRPGHWLWLDFRGEELYRRLTLFLSLTLLFQVAAIYRRPDGVSVMAVFFAAPLLSCCFIAALFSWWNNVGRRQWRFFSWSAEDTRTGADWRFDDFGRGWLGLIGMFFITVQALSLLRDWQSVPHWITFIFTVCILLIFNARGRSQRLVERLERPRLRTLFRWARVKFKNLPERLGKPAYRWQCASVMLAWLVFAVLPGLSASRTAWSDQVQALAFSEAVYLGEEIARRDTELSERYRDVAAREAIVEQWQRQKRDIYIPYRLPRRDVGDDLTRRQRDIYEIDVVASESSGAEAETDHAGNRRNAIRSLRSWVSTEIGRELALRLPHYNDTAGRLRSQQTELGQSSNWQWSSDAPKSFVLQLDHRPPSGGRHTSLHLQFGDLGPRVDQLTFCVGLLSLGALFAWVVYCAYRVFFVAFQRPSLRERDARRGALVPDRRIVRFDGPGPPSPAHGKKQLVLHGDESPGKREELLKDFEEMARAPASCEAWAVHNPYELLIRTASDPATKCYAAEQVRWIQLLARFEFWPSQDGEDVETWLDAMKVRNRAERMEVYRRRAGNAKPLFEALWQSCSPDERLVLVHLAEEGIVNPKLWRSVRALLYRGVLVRRPDLRIVDESLRLYLRENHQEDARDMEQEAVAGTSFVNVRRIFWGVAAAAVIFLYVTQRNAFEGAVAWLSALAVAVPALMRGASDLAAQLKGVAGSH